MSTKALHAILPQTMDAEGLAQWLRNNCVEQFTDQKKHYFDPEEIRDFEHESSANGREFNKLNDLKKMVANLCIKGNDEERTIVIPATAGSKALDTFRRQNDDLVERGFEVDEMEVFGIPSPETKTMEYFDIEGNHVADRSRPMSAKEKHAHMGIFNIEKERENLIETEKGDIVDTNTGEVKDLKTGTND